MATSPENLALAAQDRQDALRDAADMGAPRLAAYTLYGEFYDGQQRTILMDRLRRYLEQPGGPVRFCENFCETIVDTLADRLEVVGFTTEDNDYAKWLTDTVWQRCRMDETQGVVHTETSKLGDGALFVTWDEDRQRPKFTWNPPNLVKFVYSDDEPDELDYVVKVWDSYIDVGVAKGRARRMNLYFPDRIEKYYCLSKEGAGQDMWHAYMDDDDAGWPVAWTRPDGEPRGIPVFHFRNNPKGRQYGRSELHGVIPQQNLLNKQIIDLAEESDYLGTPNRWATGVEGTPSFKVGAGEVWTSPSADAKFGQFDAGDPTKLLQTIESTIRRMAARSRTPMHLLFAGGTLPSGESLKTAEAPLVKKAKDRQTTHGSTWEDAMLMATKLHNDFAGAEQWPEDLDIEAQWESAESRSDLADAQVAEIKEQIGVSKATLLSEMGYDPEEEAEKREAEAKAALDAAQSAIDKGQAQLPGTPGGPPGKPTPGQPGATLPAGA